MKIVESETPNTKGEERMDRKKKKIQKLKFCCRVTIQCLEIIETHTYGIESVGIVN